MKICLVSQQYPPHTAVGGVGTQTWNKANVLTALGHEVHVLAAAAGAADDCRLEMADGVRIHRIKPPGQDFEVNSPSAYAVGYSWSVLRHLRRLGQTTRFDIVNFAEYGAEGFAFQLDRAPWNWVPVIAQLHCPLAMLAERVGWPEVGSEFHRVVTFMEGESIRLADGLMASSANIADFTASYYRVPRERIRVVHCGIDCDLFRPNDAGELDGRRRTVLFVGNIVASKGARVVFEAVMRLRSKYPDVCLQLLGRDEDDECERFRRIARAAGAEGIVESLGFKSDRGELPAIYRRAHVFASPSSHEGGVANTYVEAMACGCPVIASTSGGAGEAVTDGLSGFLVPPGDVEATAAAIDRVLGDPELRRRMGDAGRRRAKEYFALDKYICRVLAAYQETIELSRRRLAALQAEAT